MGSCSTDKEKMLIENDAKLGRQGVTEVTKVKIAGKEKAYIFKVTIKSPDTGCDQYADWWEVVDLEGNLVHRSILDHSHVTEQPFTRSGENIALTKDKEVYIRVHMNNSGYASKALKGSVKNGFQATELEKDFCLVFRKGSSST